MLFVKLLTATINLYDTVVWVAAIVVLTEDWVVVIEVGVVDKVVVAVDTVVVVVDTVVGAVDNGASVDDVVSLILVSLVTAWDATFEITTKLIIPRKTNSYFIFDIYMLIYSIFNILAETWKNLTEKK